VGFEKDDDDAEIVVDVDDESFVENKEAYAVPTKKELIQASADENRFSAKRSVRGSAGTREKDNG